MGEVRSKFTEIERRVEEAELDEAFLNPDVLAPEQIEHAPMAYFQMGMACPFLIEESCGIYAERPLARREYLVTAPAEYCSAPDERVETLRPPVKAAEALARLEGTEGRRYVKKIPLGLALRWSRENAGPAPRGAAGTVREFLALLEGTRPEPRRQAPPGSSQ